MGRRRHKTVHPVSGHDGPRWLRVGQLPAHQGWYVIRTCPCHEGLPVSRAYATHERAALAMNYLLRAKQHGRIFADRRSDTPELSTGLSTWQQPQADRGHKP